MAGKQTEPINELWAIMNTTPGSPPRWDRRQIPIGMTLVASKTARYDPGYAEPGHGMDEDGIVGVVTVIAGELTVSGATSRQFLPGERFIVIAHSPEAKTEMPGYTNQAHESSGATFIADVFRMPPEH